MPTADIEAIRTLNSKLKLVSMGVATALKNADCPVHSFRCGTTSSGTYEVGFRISRTLVEKLGNRGLRKLLPSAIGDVEPLEHACQWLLEHELSLEAAKQQEMQPEVCFSHHTQLRV